MIFHIVHKHEIISMELDHKHCRSNSGIIRRTSMKSSTCNKLFKCCKGTVYNCCSCRPCFGDHYSTSSDESKYIVYRASPYGFDRILVSSRMAADHMPHVYHHVMDNLNIF